MPDRMPALSLVAMPGRRLKTLELAKEIGADETVVADGSHVDAVQDLTGGEGDTVVFDFVAEQGAENQAWAMTAPDGYQYVIGYGGQFSAPTLDFVADEVPETAAHLEEVLAQAKERDAELARLRENASFAGEPDPYKKDGEDSGNEDAAR